MEYFKILCPRGMDKEDAVYTHTYTHNGILLSHQKEFAATWVDLEIFILSEVS